jgi:hypothetical protein
VLGHKCLVLGLLARSSCSKATRSRSSRGCRARRFDLVFIDGNEERYKDYVVKTEPLWAKDGIMIVDDCLYYDDVTDTKGVGTKACMASNDWLRIALPLSKGRRMRAILSARTNSSRSMSTPRSIFARRGIRKDCTSSRVRASFLILPVLAVPTRRRRSRK